MDFNITNPFPGLRAFEEDEDILFFGREKQVDELRRKLRTVRFLAVIGSSGSGKSSLIKSGLIPSLHSGFMAGASSHWRVCTMRPGSDPIGNLAGALSEDGILYCVDNEDDAYTYRSIIESTLRRSSIGLTEAYRQSDIDANTNLLLVVDQFEELFRFSKYESDNKGGKRDAAAFINLLLKSAEQKALPLYVVLTMRSDFLGDCTAFRGLPEIINEGQYLVPRMTREERREAISGPIAVGGAEIAPELLNLLLNDVGDNPDQLPILQHALMRTWNIWEAKHPAKDKMLEVADYEAAGTMDRALSQHAEEAYHELTTPREKEVCEYIFRALTDKGTDARGIRRPQTVAELMLVANATGAEVIAIIEVFRKPGRAFLMPPADVPLHAASIIDISHESLMRVWSRLISWVEAESQSGLVYKRLCEAASQYEMGRAGLLRAPELQTTLKWKEENLINATWASRYNDEFDKAMLYLDYSRRQYDQELRQKEAIQKNRLRRAKITTAVVSVIAIGGIVLAAYALRQKNIATTASKQAKIQKDSAEIQKSKALNFAAVAVHQTALADSARKQADSARTQADSARTQAVNDRRAAIQEKAGADLAKTIAEQRAVEASAARAFAKDQADSARSSAQDAKRSAEAANRASEISRKLQKLAEARNLANQSVRYMNENKDADSKATALQAYELNAQYQGPFQNDELYNALYLNWARRIGDGNQSLLHRLPVHSIAVSPAGSLIFTIDEGGRLLALKNDNGALVKAGEVKTKMLQVRALGISREGTRLVALGADGKVTCLVWNGAAFQVLAPTVQLAGRGLGMAFDGQNNCYIATTAGITRYNIRNGLGADSSTVPLAGLQTMLYLPDGKIITASAGTLQVWPGWEDIGRPGYPSFRLLGRITALAADESGRYVAAGNADGRVWICDVAGGSTKGIRELPSHASLVSSLSFGSVAKGRLQLASASADRTIRLQDVSEILAGNFDNAVTLHGHTKWIYAVSYSPDGRYLYSSGEDNKVISWKTTLSDTYYTLKNK